MLGFDVRDKGGDGVEVKRDGRTSLIDLVAGVRIEASDPRDMWLLKRALEDEARWEAVETYFIRRFGDGAIVPVELRLGRCSDEARTPYLDHDALDGRLERTPLPHVETLLDALPVLAAPNAVGYHAARERIFARYERIRPKTWSDIGISDSALIAEFEAFSVSPDDVAHARESGRDDKDDIIAAYGLPPLKWSDDGGVSDR